MTISLNFFEYTSLELELATLPLFYQIAFAATCCERMLPNYNYFCRRVDFGKPKVPRAALNEVWQKLQQGEPIGASRVNQLIEECGNEDVFPDSLDFGGAYCYEAQEALQALLDTIDSFLNPTVENVAQVAKHARNTVEAYISERVSVSVSKEKEGREKFRKAIASHPFAVRELAKEAEDLQRLKQAQTLDRELLEWLRTSFNNDGKSLIDLS
jgi:uncharacterized protein